MDSRRPRIRLRARAYVRVDDDRPRVNTRLRSCKGGWPWFRRPWPRAAVDGDVAHPDRLHVLAAPGRAQALVPSASFRGFQYCDRDARDALRRTRRGERRGGGRRHESSGRAQREGGGNPRRYSRLLARLSDPATSVSPRSKNWRQQNRSVVLRPTSKSYLALAARSSQIQLAFYTLRIRGDRTDQ
jgi:hypothetical protein